MAWVAIGHSIWSVMAHGTVENSKTCVQTYGNPVAAGTKPWTAEVSWMLDPRDAEEIIGAMEATGPVEATGATVTMETGKAAGYMETTGAVGTVEVDKATEAWNSDFKP